MRTRPKGYKLCPGCGQPVLKKGQQPRHPDDYRHAQGCPNDDEPGFLGPVITLPETTPMP